MLECTHICHRGDRHTCTHIATDFPDKAFSWYTPGLTIYLDFMHENNSTAVVAIRAETNTRIFTWLHKYSNTKRVFG